jgi:hypothetical protein
MALVTNRRRLTIEGEELNRATVNVALAEISNRLNKLEGRAGAGDRVAPLSIVVGDETLLQLNSRYNLCLYGDDDTKIAVANGAHRVAGQWIADAQVATIFEMDGGTALRYYRNTGLIIGSGYTPTQQGTLTPV